MSLLQLRAILYVIMQREGESQAPPYDLYIDNYRKRIRLREANFNHIPLAEEGKPRTAQIKAIQKFIGRLKSDNKNYEKIIGEMETLNLSNYLDEISSLLANCINEKDIQFYSEVVTRINLDYENFPAMLLKDLLKQFSTQYQSPEDNKSRLKALLLFTTELFVIGFPFPYKEITEMLKKLVKVGTKKRTTFITEKELRLFAYYYNSQIYAAFLKNFGSIFTVATPKWCSKWSSEEREVPQYPLMIPAKTRQDFTNAFFTNYISSCLSVLDAAFERLKELQEQLSSNLKLSGEFNKQVELNYNQLKQKFVFTKIHLMIIIESMGSDVEIKNYEEDLVEVQQIMKKYINKVDNVEIFENQFEKELYSDLLEISKTQNKAAGEEEYRTFKEKLDACKNKNQSDEAVKAFEAINNKRTRKLLSKDLLEYRKEYQLVTPFLCRIAATIVQNFKDLTEWLNESVFAEYEKLRESVNTNFVMNDKKSRNLKYICEFTKFKVIDPEKTIGVIQNLIDDLKGYNIELLIAALESVGRFLYLAPIHANKFTFILSKLENVMKQKSLPLFTTSQLVNSINLLKPHIEDPKPEVPPLTPTEIEAVKVIKLDVIDQIDDIIKGIEKLISTPEGLEAVQRVLFKKIEGFDYLGNYHYAYLINELDVEKITNFIVDHTVEKLEEAVKTGDYQNCLLWSRFFGELYKYNLLKKSFLFQTIQSFFKFSQGEVGVINLVCTVLETCHGYLDSKRIPGKNQRFLLLVSFKRYIHQCLYVPMLEEFKIIDVFQDLQPNLTSIKMQVLDTFLKEMDAKNDPNEIDFSRELDQYLEKCHLKEDKNIKIDDPEDKRNGETPSMEKEGLTEEKNSQVIMKESKVFDSEFLNVMNSHIKDLTGRIAKPAFVEKVIEKKRERKKVNEGEQKRTVIGRCGTKFVKKEVVYAAKQEESTFSQKKEE